MTDEGKTRLSILGRAITGPFRMLLRAVVLTVLAPVGAALAIRMLFSGRELLGEMACVLLKRSFTSPLMAWLMVPLHVLTSLVTIPFVLLGALAAQVGLGSASASLGTAIAAGVTFALTPGMHQNDVIAIAVAMSVTLSSLIYVAAHYLATAANDEGDE